MTKDNKETLTLVVSVVSIMAFTVMSYMAYRVSSDVHSIQKNSEKRASAIELKQFWNDMHKITQSGANKSGELASSLTKFLISSGELFDEHNRLKHNPNSLDLKYNLAFAEFIGSYGEVISKIEGIAIEYDYTRLKYHSLANEHNLIGWSDFFKQTADVIIWRNELNSTVQEIYNLTYGTVNNSIDPSLTSKKLKILSVGLGQKISLFSIPYLKGLNQFTEKNLDIYSRQLH